MKVSFFQRLENLSYSVARISAGLFLHPYQTMQSLIEDTQLVWLTLIPSIFLGVVTILWRTLIVPIAQLFSSCTASPWWVCRSLNGIADWVVCLMVIWQVLLLYLLFRFRWIQSKWQNDQQ